MVGLVKAIAIAFAMLFATGAKAEWAIAVGQSPDGTWVAGYAWDQSSQAEAENNALRSCFARAPINAHCRIVLRGESGCFALATTSENGWGAAARGSEGEAKVAAVLSCLNGNPGYNCYARDVYCDTTGGFKPYEAWHDSTPIIPPTPRPMAPPTAPSIPPCSNWPYYNICKADCGGTPACIARCQETIEFDVGRCIAD